MKKILALTLVFLMAIFLAACSSASNDSQQRNSSQQTSDSQRTSNGSGGSNAASSGGKVSSNKKILLAYFSYTGHTREIAREIHNRVGGDIFEIKTVTPYSKDYNTTAARAQKEQQDNARPKLASRVSNMDSYDVIFVGYPCWWGTMPMALFTFLEEYNFSGKTIVPFTTHGGSGFGRSLTDIHRLLPKSTITEGLAVRDTDVGNAQGDISRWLKSIHMTD